MGKGKRRGGGGPPPEDPQLTALLTKLDNLITAQGKSVEAATAASKSIKGAGTTFQQAAASLKEAVRSLEGINLGGGGGRGRGGGGGGSTRDVIDDVGGAAEELGEGRPPFCKQLQFDKLKKPLEEANKKGDEHFAAGVVRFRLIDSLMNRIHASVQETNEIQKKALGLGSDSKKVFMRVDKNVGALPGGIGQTMQSFGEQLAAGLRKPENNKFALLLANQMKATGQDSGKLATSLRALDLIGNTSVAVQQDLALNILSLSERFGVETGRLVEAMGMMGERMLEFGELGIADDIAQSAAQFTAAVPGMESTLKGFLDNFTGESMDSLVNAYVLGGQGIREDFAGGQAQLEDIIGAAKHYANEHNRLNEIFGQFPDTLARQGFINQQFTNATRQGLALTQEWNKAVANSGMSEASFIRHLTEEREIRADFNQSLDQLRKEILDPITRFVLTVFPKVIKVLTENKDMILALIGAIGALTAITAIRAGVGAIGRIGGISRAIAGTAIGARALGGMGSFGTATMLTATGAAGGGVMGAMGAAIPPLLAIAAVGGLIYWAIKHNAKKDGDLSAEIANSTRDTAAAVQATERARSLRAARESVGDFEGITRSAIQQSMRNLILPTGFTISTTGEVIPETPGDAPTVEALRDQTGVMTQAFNNLINVMEIPATRPNTVRRRP